MMLVHIKGLGVSPWYLMHDEEFKQNVWYCRNRGGNSCKPVYL